MVFNISVNMIHHLSVFLMFENEENYMLNH